MKKLVFLGACLLALASSPTPAHATDPGIVVVRIYEGETMARVVISHGGGKDEVVEFPNGRPEKRLTASAEGYHKVISQLYQGGCSLKGTFSAAGTNVPTTTLLFLKG